MASNPNDTAVKRMLEGRPTPVLQAMLGALQSDMEFCRGVFSTGDGVGCLLVNTYRYAFGVGLAEAINRISGAVSDFHHLLPQWFDTLPSQGLAPVYAPYDAWSKEYYHQRELSPKKRALLIEWISDTLLAREAQSLRDQVLTPIQPLREEHGAQELVGV